MKINRVTNIFPTFGQKTIEIQDGDENLKLDINDILFTFRAMRFNDKEIMNEFHALVKNTFTDEINRGIIWGTLKNILIAEHYLVDDEIKVYKS